MVMRLEMVEEEEEEVGLGILSCVALERAVVV